MNILDPGLEQILVIDDEDAVREGLQLILEGEGYHVQASVNAFDAIEIIREKEISVVLCDLNMPGMSGLELLSTCRTLAPEIVIIMISGLPTRRQPTRPGG